jgi:AmmeMemoRadiSam system protein B
MKRNQIVFLTSLVCFALLVIFIKIYPPKPEVIITPEIKGLILPHHDLAKELFHLSLEKLKLTTQPQTIVVFGTNHYFPTSQTYTTTTAIHNEFQLGSDVLADDARIEKEHSIQTVSPYIKEYFPNTTIIPIIISARYENVEYIQKSVAQFVSLFDGPNTLYIASVDFAHNVSLSQGMAKNQESIQSIENFNISEILQYQDDHLDSPLAITTLLVTMQQIGASHWETWYSSHGALITQTPDLNGTSYVIGAFSK